MEDVQGQTKQNETKGNNEMNANGLRHQPKETNSVNHTSPSEEEKQQVNKRFEKPRRPKSGKNL